MNKGADPIGNPPQFYAHAREETPHDESALDYTKIAPYPNAGALFQPRRKARRPEVGVEQVLQQLGDLG